MKYAFLHCLALLCFLACRRSTDNLIETAIEYDFNVYEQLGDNLLASDTFFTKRKIYFKASQEITPIEWTIGSKIFNEPSVTLYFTAPIDIDLKLRAIKNDSKEELILTKKISLVDENVLSPIEGRYRGTINRQSSDSFDVVIKHWFGNRYPWWPQGAYSLHNLPRGYTDSTKNFNGNIRPEIDGIIISPGFKNFSFDQSGFVPAQGIKGYGTIYGINRDTLFMTYSIINMTKYNQEGEIEYLNRTYTGIRR